MKYRLRQWQCNTGPGWVSGIIAVFLISCTSAVQSSSAYEQPGSAGESFDRSRSITSSAHRQMGLNDCFNRADRDNKEIAVAACTLSVSEAAVVIARAIPNPTYNMTYGWGPAWDYIVAGNNQQIGLTEEIQVAGRRSKKVGVAKAATLQMAFQLEAVRFDVHNRIRRSYAELAAAKAYATLIETQREIALRLLEITQKRFDAGKAPGAQVLQSKLSVMQFDTQRNLAQGRLVQDSAQLAQLLGEIPAHEEIIDVDDNYMFQMTNPIATTLVPDTKSRLPGLDELLPTAWQQRNDLKAAIQQAHVDRKALTLAKTARIPDPSIGFDYFYSAYNRYQPRYFDPSGSGLSGDPRNKVPQQPGYLLTVSQEQPLFYHYQGQIAQAKINWIQQLKQNDQNRAQIANDIVVAYESMIVARDNIEQFQNHLLTAALKVSQLSRRGYELGKTDLATAVLAQQQYQQIRSAYFDSVTAYQNAWADLEKAVGVPIKL